MTIPIFKPKVEYQREADDDRRDPYLLADLALAKRIAACIEFHYFSQPFEIFVQHEQGVAMIWIPHLMGQNNKYCLHIKDLYNDPQLKAVVNACGELLEMYNIPRAAFDKDEWLAALNEVPLIDRVSGRGYIPT